MGKRIKEAGKYPRQGDTEQQYHLGINYEEGICGVPQDYAKALKWYKKAAKKGYTPAQFAVGEMYEKGLGVPQDKEKALKWYKKAANK